MALFHSALIPEFTFYNIYIKTILKSLQSIFANSLFTFYNIYIKTCENGKVAVVMIKFTFYNIYIKTLFASSALPVNVFNLHSIIFILKRKS